MTLMFLTLSLAALTVSLAYAVWRTRTVTAPLQGVSCELTPKHDRVLAYDWTPEAHRKVAATLRRYGHRTHADLHADVADRLEVEQRLEHVERNWRRDHPPVRELRLRRVLS